MRFSRPRDLGTASILAGFAVMAFGAGTAPALAASPTVTVRIQSPVPGSVVDGTITASGTASGSKFAIRSVSVAVDSGSFQPANGTSGWTLPLNTQNTADGSHTLTARA